MVRGKHKVSDISGEAIFAVRTTKPAKFLFSIIFCLLLILFDLRFNFSSFLRGYSYDLILPILSIAELPKTFVSSVSSALTSRKELMDILEDYRKDNNKLQTINSQLKEMTRINQ